MEISKSADTIPIKELSDSLGIEESEFIPYGKYCAKIDSQKILKRLEHQPDGNYVIVTGITPTKSGEGKTTLVMGLSQSIGAHKGKKVFACIRQPSQGPTFGLKGGANGGGFSQCVPSELMNLHLTGDIHAIAAANNLIAAAMDTRIFHEKSVGNNPYKIYNKLVPKDKEGKRKPFTPAMLKRLKKLGIAETDPAKLTKEEVAKFSFLNINVETIQFNRVVDANDRMLRNVIIGQGNAEKDVYSRTASYSIAVASEIMSIVSLSQNLEDLRTRMGKIVLAYDHEDRPVTTEDLGIAGAATVLLKDTLDPTLMQSLERTPVFVHTGPFANISYGNSSVLADKIASKLVGSDGYFVTECGFGADVGFEKFINIKCRTSGFKPSAIVLNVTLKAIYSIGEKSDEYKKELNIESEGPLKEGCKNLVRHIKIIKSFGVECIVCINIGFPSKPEDVEYVKSVALEQGAFEVVFAKHWKYGGAGATQVADAVIKCSEQQKGKPSQFKLLYENELGILEKIKTIATKIYGAKDIKLSKEALESLEKLSKIEEFSKFPLCMAKTPYSFGDNPEMVLIENEKPVEHLLLKNSENYVLPIRDLKVQSGAGFIIVYVGEILTMPGLPLNASYLDIDINTKTGEIEGLC